MQTTTATTPPGSVELPSPPRHDLGLVAMLVPLLFLLFVFFYFGGVKEVRRASKAKLIGVLLATVALLLAVSTLVR